MRLFTGVTGESEWTGRMKKCMNKVLRVEHFSIERLKRLNRQAVVHLLEIGNVALGALPGFGQLHHVGF